MGGGKRSGKVGAERGREAAPGPGRPGGKKTSRAADSCCLAERRVCLLPFGRRCSYPPTHSGCSLQALVAILLRHMTGFSSPPVFAACSSPEWVPMATGDPWATTNPSITFRRGRRCQLRKTGAYGQGGQGLWVGIAAF